MENLQRIEFNKIRNTSEILYDYWKFLKSEWKQFGIALAVCVLPFSLIGAYFSKDVAAEIEQGILSFNLLKMFLFSFLGKFMGMYVSCVYVLNYMTQKSFNADDFKSGLLPAFLASCIMIGIEILGFCMLILPGFLLLPAMSIYVFDVLLAHSCGKQVNYTESVKRCVTLSFTNFGQSAAVVALTYLIIVVLSEIFGSILGGNYIIEVVASSILTVFSETFMVAYILLYYSLLNKNQAL